ncbi:PadR family transcriptional regulator [Virgibacillus halodenitrificans]|uniref:PadR family transcriptional regulator n=1 Tax=Virgibacillus halodenitrificans TaxID=1482 RepID=UPI000EF4927D|nr:PadR family transcriptional regulator [Virgibacillus halodenitrificans]
MSIQVFILSKLMEGNNYPYKVKKELSEFIPLDKLTRLTESKLYYHFESLTKHGYIEVVEVIKEEHRPDKQVFAITDKGRKEFPQKIYKLFEKGDSIRDFLPGLENIKYVDRSKIVEILERKIDGIHADWEKTKDFGKRVKGDHNNETIIHFVRDYFSTRTEHTLYWMEELVNLIKEEKI